MYYEPMMNGFEMSGWGSMFMGFSFLVILIAIVIAIAVFMRREDRDRSGPEPVDIAKQRYARGEITKEQYDQILKDLR